MTPCFNNFFFHSPLLKYPGYVTAVIYAYITFQDRCYRLARKVSLVYMILFYVVRSVQRTVDIYRTPSAVRLLLFLYMIFCTQQKRGFFFTKMR